MRSELELAGLGWLAVLGFALGVCGCYLDMPLGTPIEPAGPDADTDSDTDSEGPVECVRFDARSDACRLPVGAPPSETFDAPVAWDAVLHRSDVLTFTALEADTTGRLYAFFWWLPRSEFADADVPVEHLAWRTRPAGEGAWSEIRAVPGVTREDFINAICWSPSNDLLRFTATDDGYVHAFWRKNQSCAGGAVWHIEHAIFSDGEIAFRKEMPIECRRGTDLQVTDVMAMPDGAVTVAFLCGYVGRLQTYSCGCWDESVSVGVEDEDGELERQDDLQLETLGGDTWAVVRTRLGNLWARKLSDPGEPGSFRPISIERNAFGSPVVFPDGEGGMWVTWQAVSVPSSNVSVARLVGNEFADHETLPAGAEADDAIQAICGAWVPEQGAILLTDESTAEAAGDHSVVRGEFFVRMFVDGGWSEPWLAAFSEAELDGVLARHTASDLAVTEGQAYLAYAAYTDGEKPYELRVVEVEP